MKKHVFFVESAAGMGGVEFSTVNVAKMLDRSQWNPVVISPAEGDLSLACRENGIPVEIIPLPQLWSTSWRFGDFRFPNPFAWLVDALIVWQAAGSLGKFLRSQQTDLVITKGMFAHFYGGLAAHKMRLPLLWHLQDFVSERWGGLYRWIFGAFATWLPDRIVADGKAIVEQLPSRLRAKSEVILNAVDTSAFHPHRATTELRRSLAIPEDALVIGHVARMTPWKGQHHLVDAFITLAPQQPQTYLLLVGSALFEKNDYEHMLKARVSQAGLDERVIFCGYRHDLAAILSVVDVFVYPSVEKDTSPLALLSALACGLPVVAFDIPGVREVLAGSEQQILLPVGDQQKLCQALTIFLNDSRRRCIAANEARHHALQHFSLAQHAAKMQEVMLETMIQKTGKHQPGDEH